MLQDILPHHFHNEYQEKEITAQSRVLCFHGKTVYIARNDKNELRLPEYEEVKDRLPLYAKLQYLFTIEEEDFFLLDSAELLKEEENYHYEKVRTLKQLVSKEVCFTVMTAYHLYMWYRDNRYCGRCGNEVVHDTK